jgi:hypothetical protein
MTQTLNQKQVDELLRKWPMRQEARPTSEDFEGFKPIKEEFERLHRIPESQRTPWQVEAHSELLATLFLEYSDSAWFAWDRKSLSEAEMNAAAAHHLKQYQQ